jgi:DNA polymerase V
MADYTGFPSPAEDYVERSLDLNAELVRRPAATFFVRVQGDAFRADGIRSGDILVVDRSLAPNDDRVVIAVQDGELAVRRFRDLRKRGDEAHVWGVVTAAIRRL